MSYKSPGMIDGNNKVSRDRARTEVLASAFSEAAGEYFARQKEYEDNISEAEETQDRMKKVAGGAIAVGLVLVVVGVIENILMLSAVGVLVGIAGAAYAYYQFTNATERIENNEAKIERNEPDGEVSFVSQIGVPMYLVPYQDDHMVFDGLDVASETTLHLANIDGDALIAQQRELDERKQLYDELLADETVVSPDLLAEFAPNIGEHRQLERPLLDDIETMTAIARDIERDTIHANVWANDQKAQSMATLADGGLLESGSDLPIVEIRQSMSECEALVDEIRGVEEQAISGDMLDQARESRAHVDDIASELGRRLQENEKMTTEHYDAYSARVEDAVTKHVCSECLNDRINDIADEFGLVDQLLSSEAGSLGIALSDDDLDEELDGDESFTDRIRADIEAAVPEIDGEIKQAYNRLDDLGPDSDYCQTHGEVETTRVEDSGALFGEVWRSLYYTFRSPIMESVDEFEQEAEEIRQNKEQKKMDLAQYEQIKDEAEQRYYAVKSDYDTARNIERSLN